VGKSTTTLLFGLLAAASGDRVLVIDLDPECGTSRDFLGPALPQVKDNLRTVLESPAPVPLPLLATGIDGLDLLAGAPDQQRFFRLYPEHSPRLRESLRLLSPDAYRWILMDVPNQYDNIAELGLIAADCVLLPVELTEDCCSRLPTVLRVLEEARALNPRLAVLGALTLASAPRANQPLGLTAKERLVRQEYERALKEAGITLLRTVMFRSATTVEEARSNADIGLLHWKARQRFQNFRAEVVARLRSLSLSSPSSSRHERPDDHDRPQPRRAAAAAHA
jgi:chromosome partitioning protein